MKVINNVKDAVNQGRIPHYLEPGWTKEGLVYFSEGVKSIGGHESGVHDGIRDGYSSSRSDWTNNCRFHCTKQQWIDAGNELPIGEPVIRECSARLNSAMNMLSDPEFELRQCVDGSYRWTAGMFDKGTLTKAEGEEIKLILST